MLSLGIQTNSLLSLSELDLGIFFGNLMNSKICIVIPGIQLTLGTLKLSCHCCVNYGV